MWLHGSSKVLRLSAIGFDALVKFFKIISSAGWGSTDQRVLLYVEKRVGLESVGAKRSTSIICLREWT